MRFLKGTLLTFLVCQTLLFGSSLFEEEMEDCKRGKCGALFSEEAEEPKFFVFASFSMPDITWVALSKEMEKRGGAFLLRGLPDNSFQALLSKIMELRQKGVHAPISIDPERFEKCSVTAVPTFMVETKEGFRKLSGNIPVSEALEELGGVQ